jgi:hypothetical protein
MEAADRVAVSWAEAKLVVAETVAAAATAAAELVVAEMEGPVPICSGPLVIRPNDGFSTC